MPDWLIWVIVAIVVLAVVAALAVAANKKNKERNRAQAGELRQEAATTATAMQQREAHARETEAKAAASRAEADRKQAEAERLEAEAHERQQAVARHRQEHEDHLRRADELDPDVDTKSDDYTGPNTTQNGTTTQASHPDSTRSDRSVGDGPTTVTHPDGSTEAVRPPEQDQSSQRTEDRSTDASAEDPTDPRATGGGSTGGGSHRR